VVNENLRKMGPSVSLILVVHLDLPLSPQIFENIWNDPKVIFRGLGQDDSWKYLKQKISWHCPFNYCIWKLFLLNFVLPLYCVYTAEIYSIRLTYSWKTLELEYRIVCEPFFPFQIDFPNERFLQREETSLQLKSSLRKCERGLTAETALVF
jgi:hypothetical protein